MGDCTSGIGNTGVTSCLPTDSPVSGLLFQQTENSAGVTNELLGASIGTAGYLTDLAKNIDDTVRLVPLQNVVEVLDERGDDEFYADDSKAEYFLQNGQRIFNGEILTNASPQLYGELLKWKNTQTSVYTVHIDKAIHGDDQTTGNLAGFEIVRGTMSFSYVKFTRVKPSHIKIKFTYAETVVDENIRQFEEGEIADDAQRLEGLIPVNAIINGVVTIASYTVDIAAIYGSAKKLIAAEGLLLADFVMTEITPTPGITTITSTLESSVIPGQYLITVTTSSADVNELTLSQTGLDKGFIMAVLTVTTP